jgi:hypothetical protein
MHVISSGVMKLTLLLALMAIASTVRAAEVWSFEIPAHDFVLVLSGTVENGKSIDLSGSIRVRLVGPTEKKAFLRADFSDVAPKLLQDWPNLHVIPKNSLVIDEKELTAGRAADLSVSLKNQTVPGTYAGSVELSVVGTSAPHVVVPVLVVIRELPMIQLLDKPETAMLSNCSTLCGLTEWLLPGALRDQLHVTVFNKSPFPIKVEPSGIWRGRGSGSATSTTKGETQLLEMASAQDNKGEVNIIPAGTPVQFTIKVDRAHLSADHYKVEAQLKAVPVGQLPGPQDSQAMLPAINQSFETLPLAVDIRDGALVPVLLVFFGVVLGRVFSLLRSPSMISRLALYKQTEMLRKRIRDLSDPAAQEGLNKELDDLWAGMDTGSVTLQSFQDSMTDIAKKVDTLLKQQEVVATAKAKMPSEISGPIGELMDKSRLSLIEPGIRPEALRNFDAAMDLYHQGLHLRAAVAGERLEHQYQRVHGLRARATRKIAAFVGIDTLHSTAFFYTYMRPLFYFLIILAVGLSGAFSQYASDAHSTFGASYLDYLSIALWGFGSQVVAATFSDIQSVK